MQGCTVFAAIFGLLPAAVAHGFIEWPQLRGGIAGRVANAYCPHCGNGNGVCGDGGQWGANSDFLNFASGPVTTLNAGSIAEFSVQIRAPHMGFFEFSICDTHVDRSLADPQGCFNRMKLQRAPPSAQCVVNDANGDCQPLDTRHPERWYVPPGAGTFKMRYEIPAALRCSSCTLQWQWFTANSCTPGEDTGCYWADFASKGWNKQAWCGTFCGHCSSLLQANTSSSVAAGNARGCGEEFRNCADIRVVPGGADDNTTPPREAIPSDPVSEPQTEPESEPEVEPEFESEDRTTMPSTQTALPKSECGSCTGCIWSDKKCYFRVLRSVCESSVDHKWCGESQTMASTTMPSTQTALPKSQCGSCTGCIWSDGVCYSRVLKSVCESSVDHMWCGASSSASSAAVPSAQCGSCTGCKWSNGQCYMDASRSYCESWSDNVWCGAPSLAQVRRHRPKFLGMGLIQEGANSSRSALKEEL